MTRHHDVERDPADHPASRFAGSLIRSRFALGTSIFRGFIYSSTLSKEGAFLAAARRLCQADESLFAHASPLLAFANGPPLYTGPTWKLDERFILLCDFWVLRVALRHLN